MYTDAEYLVRYYDEVFDATYFGGEALPVPTLMLGYAAWGGPAHFRPDTVWMEPILGVDDDLTAFRFDWSHRWWVELQELSHHLTVRDRNKKGAR